MPPKHTYTATVIFPLARPPDGPTTRRGLDLRNWSIGTAATAIVMVAFFAVGVAWQVSYVVAIAVALIAAVVVALLLADRLADERRQPDGRGHRRQHVRRLRRGSSTARADGVAASSNR